MKELHKISSSCSEQNDATSDCGTKHKRHIMFSTVSSCWHVVLMWCFLLETGHNVLLQQSRETTTTYVCVYSESVSSERLWTTSIFQYLQSFSVIICDYVTVFLLQIQKQKLTITQKTLKCHFSLCMFAQQAETASVTRQHAGLGSTDRWLKPGLVSSSSGKN